MPLGLASWMREEWSKWPRNGNWRRHSRNALKSTTEVKELFECWDLSQSGEEVVRAGWQTRLNITVGGCDSVQVVILMFSPLWSCFCVSLVFVFAEFILNITVSGCNSVMSRRNFCTLWPSDGVLLVFVYTVVVLLFLVFSSMRFRTIVVVVVFIQLMIFLSSSRYWSTCMLLLTSRQETNVGSLKSGTVNLLITCRLHHELWLVYLVRDHHYFDGYGLWALIITISTRLTSPSGTESQLLALRPLDNSISGLSDFCQIHIYITKISVKIDFFNQNIPIYWYWDLNPGSQTSAPGP